MDKISKQNEEFNPTFYCDNETFIEKLLKIGKQLQKKHQFTKRNKKIYATAKPLIFFFIFFGTSKKIVYFLNILLYRLYIIINQFEIFCEIYFYCLFVIRKFRIEIKY